MQRRRAFLLIVAALAGWCGVDRVCVADGATGAAETVGAVGVDELGVPPELERLKWASESKVLSYEVGRVYVFVLTTPTSKGLVCGLPPIRSFTDDRVTDVVREFGSKVRVIEVAKDEPVDPRSFKGGWAVAVDPDGVIYGRFADEFHMPQMLVVDGKGRVVWQGSLGGAKCVVRRVVEGRFDAKKMAEENLACGKLLMQAGAAAREQDFAGVDDSIAECIRLIPEDRVSFEFQRFERTNRPVAVTDHLRAAEAVISDASLSEIEMVQRVADALENDFLHPNLAVALRGWMKAVELTSYQRAEPLVRAAGIQAKLGEWDEAVRLQALAVAVTPEKGRAEEAEKLGLYQRHLIEAPAGAGSLFPQQKK